MIIYTITATKNIQTLNEVALNEYDVSNFAKKYIKEFLNKGFDSDKFLSSPQADFDLPNPFESDKFCLTDLTDIQLDEITSDFGLKMENELSNMEIHTKEKIETITNVTECRMTAYAIKKSYPQEEYTVIIESHDLVSGLKGEC